MPETSQSTYLVSTLTESILQTLIYFDIFQHPLRVEEILKCCRKEDATMLGIEAELAQLVSANVVKQEGDFFALQLTDMQVNKRISNNDRADKYYGYANKIGRFISLFPFVRAVFVSGSLSKGVMAKDGDIDFFIITKPGRLWIARTMLIAFRKTILFNSHKFFCVNYFVDEDNLVIEDKNLFTATETAFLIPVYGKEYYSLFLANNQWYRNYYPAFPQRPVENVPSAKIGLGKKMIEFFLNGRVGEWLDANCMKITLIHRKKKFKMMGETDFQIALKTRKYVSKHHPSHFQKRVHDALQQKVNYLEEHFGIRISSPF